MTEIQQFDRFFELPLDRWNLFTNTALKRSKIVLASDLNPVIDFFNADGVGIGARSADQAAAELNLVPHDKERLSALLKLRSYDVYTLRAALGTLLPAEEFERLALPDDEKRLLEEYTRDYTRALFKLIFEDGQAEATDRNSMRAMLEGSSREIVQKNVMALAGKFDIVPEQLVNYIAGLGEMMLAIAFYRRCFDNSRALMQEFLIDIKGLYDDKILHYRHVHLARRSLQMLTWGAQTVKILDQYFKSFNEIGQIWDNITPERFRQLRDGIERQYPLIGTILCIWQVKLNDWANRFYNKRGKKKDGSPELFATFFGERIYPNFEKVETYLNSVRDLKHVLS